MKLVNLIIAWVVVIFTYIILTVAMPAIGEITADAEVSINASGNMTQQPGISGAVGSAPVWLWFVPGLIGIGYTVWILKIRDRFTSSG